MGSMWNENELQPSWYPNFADDFHDDYFKQFEAEERVDVKDQFGRWRKTIWRAKFGAANHAFDTYCYNLAALEIFANDWCRLKLGMEALEWPMFWENAKEGYFYTDMEAENKES